MAHGLAWHWREGFKGYIAVSAGRGQLSWSPEWHCRSRGGSCKARPQLKSGSLPLLSHAGLSSHMVVVCIDILCKSLGDSHPAEVTWGQRASAVSPPDMCEVGQLAHAWARRLCQTARAWARRLCQMACMGTRGGPDGTSMGFWAVPDGMHWHQGWARWHKHGLLSCARWHAFAQGWARWRMHGLVGWARWHTHGLVGFARWHMHGHQGWTWWRMHGLVGIARRHMHGLSRCCRRMRGPLMSPGLCHISHGWRPLARLLPLLSAHLRLALSPTGKAHSVCVAPILSAGCLDLACIATHCQSVGAALPSWACMGTFPC